ncbi:hypothetical protein ZTR_03146 [Talaromyces verruculosus]|nr:hypothetical protein ZTR_03146 [Talaromyces verruculosus]
MDHLPQPRDTTTKSFEIFKVPFIANIDYDRNGFTTFPAREGFNFEDPSHSGDAIAAFLQSWLYFGLLEEFIGNSVDRSTFLYREKLPNGTIEDHLSTAALKDLKLFLWPLQDDEEYDETVEDPKFLELLDYARGQCFIIDQIKPTSPGSLPVILFSIRILIDTLRYVCTGAKAIRLWPLAVQNAEPTLTVNLLTDLMIASGWCPFQTQHVLTTFHPSLVYYTAQLRRHNQNWVTHDHCSTAGCIAFNVTSEYKPRHVREGCQCDFVEFPEEDMKKIVRDGGIPLVRINQAAHKGITSLEVKSATANDSYVAFSHVWSDGLGNEKENKLLRCQLERLARYLNTAPRPESNVAAGQVGSVDMRRMNFTYRPQYFWLDTLCIPIRPKNRRNKDRPDEKDMAIQKITPIFSGASRVMILDYEMEQVSVDTPWREIATRFLYCPWMGRCWTLEEGALCLECIVECKSGSWDPKQITQDRSMAGWLSRRPTQPMQIFHFGKLAVSFTTSYARQIFQSREKIQRLRYIQKFERRVRRMLDVALERHLGEMFLDGWKEVQQGEELDDEYSLQFSTCWNSLSERQTSKPKDRIIILANLLDLQSWRISAFDSPIIPLLRSMPVIPLSLFYIRQSPEGLDKKEKAAREGGNRWIPSLGPGVMLLSPKPYLKWTEENSLILRNPPPSTHLLILDLTTADISRPIILEAPDLGKYKFRVLFPENEEEIDPTKKKPRTIALLIDRQDIGQGIDIDPWQELELDGACFEVVTEFIDSEHYLTLYHCPVLVQTLPREAEVDSSTTVFAYRPCSNWTLEIKHDCPKSAAILTRPHTMDYTATSTLIFSVTVLPFTIMEAVSFYIFIALTIMYFSSLPPLGKIVYILTFVFRIMAAALNYIAVWDAGLLVLTVLYAFAKGISSHGLSKLDYAFIVLSALGHAGTIIIILVYKYAIRPSIYKEWLDSYQNEVREANGERIPETDWKWATLGHRGLDFIFDFILGS